MYTKTTLAKKRAPFVRLLLDLTTENANVVSIADHDGHESRAVRLVGDSTRFMVVSFTKTSKERYLKSWLEENTKPGECIAREGAKYVFLGFTENNLKAGHILFFREGPDFTVEELRDHFGTDLKEVYRVHGYGKYAARLGLSFSSTVATEEIEPEDRQLLPDLTADDGSLTSDGCGLIRESYAHDQSRILGVPLDTAVFQIRLGGIKGTVTSCPDVLFDRICRSNGKKIAYRSSMVKYNEGPHVLEVQNVSRAPKAGRLNKQFIVLLLTLGIPLSVFEELLQMQLSEIDAVTTHREKALECVDGEVDAEANGFYQELYEMLLAGHDMNEPYLATLLRRFQTTARDALRSKLNIPVKASGYLLGVVDYCGVLKEGEVYMNLPTRGGTQVGPVVLMRNPAYDTNGVRVLNGVNKPKLRHLTNCIVFAATGAHSETDRMGGGDLDGDQYFFITDPSLIPQRRVALAPSASPRPITRSQTITMAGRTQTVSHSTRTGRSIDMRTDAIQTFLTLRCNFLLGSISNEWMARVGSTPALADSLACRALIPMLEAALDIVKSGGSPAILRSNFELFKTQHVKSHTEGWRNPLDILAAHVPSAPPTSARDFACDPQLVLQKNVSADRWDELVRSAEGVMREYNRALSVAIAADKDAKLYGLQEDEKRADMAKADVIARHFPPVQNILEDLPQYLLKASVWYFTGYKHGKQSFAWLGGRWLNYIKAHCSGHVPIAVGARSTALTGAPTVPMPATPLSGSASVPAIRPPTPISLPRSRPSPAPARLQSQHVPSPSATIVSDDSDSDGVESEEYELIDRESAYDTALEGPLPVVPRLRIDTTPITPSRRIVRENSDDTLVDAVLDLPRPQNYTPLSPISPAGDAFLSSGDEATVQLQTRRNGRSRPLEPARAQANITITRPRRQQRVHTVPRVSSPEPLRACSFNPTRTPDSRPGTHPIARTLPPMPATPATATSPHTHRFLIQLSGSRRARVCTCGAIWPGSAYA